MKLKSIGCIITYLLFTSPVLSMNLRDTKPQQDVLQVPITIIKETPNRYRSNCPIVIEAYYQSGCVSVVFYEINESVLITISNISTGDSIYSMGNALDNYVSVNIKEILSNGQFEVLIMTESGEMYRGNFTL